MTDQLPPESPPNYAWIAPLQARGLGGALSVALDVLEPFGPLGAQVIWVLQPTVGLFVGREVLKDIAEALETPGGIEALRQQLSE